MKLFEKMVWAAVFAQIRAKRDMEILRPTVLCAIKGADDAVMELRTRPVKPRSFSPG